MFNALTHDAFSAFYSRFALIIPCLRRDSELRGVFLLLPDVIGHCVFVFQFKGEPTICQPCPPTTMTTILPLQVNIEFIS